MDLAEDMLKYIINYVLENAPEEMNFFNSFVDKGLLERLHNVANDPVPAENTIRKRKCDQHRLTTDTGTLTPAWNKQ